MSNKVEPVSDRAAKRAEVLDRLNQALRDDPRLAGAVLVGSGAYGFQDDESDIDLVAPVAAGYDAAAVFGDWKGRIGNVIPVRYQAETAFTEHNHLLVLLCDDLLEVDLSFPAIGSLRALTPNWRVLWERSDEVTHSMSLPPAGEQAAGRQAYIWTLNRAVHRVIYTAKALRRGQVWKALLLLDELRSRTAQLACMDILDEIPTDALGPQGVERYIDRLPPDVLAGFSRTLPSNADAQAVRGCLAASVEVVLRYAAALDRRYGVEHSQALAALLGQHLEA